MKKNNVVRNVLFVMVAMTLVCITQVYAGTVAYWQMDESTSGQIELLLDTSGNPEITRDLYMQFGWSDYSNVDLPVAPNGKAVVGNVAYMRVYGSQGMYSMDPNWYDDDSYTLEVFYRRAGIDAAGALFGNGHIDGYEGIAYIAVGADGTIEMRLVGGDVGVAGNHYDTVSAPGPDDTNWHHLAYTFNNGTVTVYVDYTLAGITTARYYDGRVISDYCYLTVGWSNPYSGSGFNGDIDELRISDTVLLTTEFLGSNVSTPQPETCANVWAFGFGLAADLNHDCRVSFADFAVFGNQWLAACNDPQDPSCVANW